MVFVWTELSLDWFLYGQPVFVWTGFLPDVLLIVIVLVVSPHKITTMAFVG